MAKRIPKKPLYTETTNTDSFKLPEDVQKKLAAEALAQNRSISNMICQIVIERFK